MSNPFFSLGSLFSAMLMSALVNASENNISDVQDMSDPLAVYTSAGIGYTDKGLNFKYAQAYDTGTENRLGMNVVEIKGVFGEAIGWNSEAGMRSQNSDSIDSIRFRNLSVNTETGTGSQVDVNFALSAANSLGYDLGTQGTISYSLVQAMPELGSLSLFPLAGVGVATGHSYDSSNNGAAQAQDRWDLHGTFYTVGMYSKYQLTDKVWLNYNPMYSGTMSGSAIYKESGIGGDSSLLLHEAAVSYQIDPRTNIRYFANWSENTRYSDGDHRVELNYQF